MRDGATPLYIAAQRGHLKVVQLLVQAGVEIDKATTDTRTTPLQIATHNCHVEVARLLIDSGADRHQARTVDGAPRHIDAANQSKLMKIAHLI